MAIEDYGLIGDVLAYPREGYAECLERARAVLAEQYSDAAQLLDNFAELLPSEDLMELQELHTRSFDVQAITTLDVGYVLFGEDYKRGELLANLSREHREAGNDCGTELGDSLPNLLHLLPKMTDVALRDELVQEIVVPALRKMIAEFDPKRLEKKDAIYMKHHKTIIDSSAVARTVYRFALQALYAVLAADFELIDKPLIEKTSDFLRCIGTEMVIEGDQDRMRPPGS